MTRNLDGTGANAWPEGSVYGNWGQTGNGRVELNAYDTPRMSVYSQGMSYNDATEEIRIGDLYGQWGYNTNTYGAAFGSYKSGKANITIDPTNGNRIRNYNQDVIKLTGTAASFENFITLGTNGGIRQGTGTWGSSFTGTAMWNDSGVMNVGGWNNNVKQWWGGSDGKLYAGGGDIRIDDTGISIKPGNSLRFTTGIDEQVVTAKVQLPGSYNNCPTLVFNAQKKTGDEAAIQFASRGDSLNSSLMELSHGTTRLDAKNNSFDGYAKITFLRRRKDCIQCS